METVLSGNKARLPPVIPPYTDPKRRPQPEAQQLAFEAEDLPLPEDDAIRRS